MYSKALYILICISAILISLVAIPLVYVNSETEPELPSITSIVEPNPAINIGPGSPVIVFPGETFTVILKQKYATTSIYCGYIYSIELIGEELVLRNYTVNVSVINETFFNITIPHDAESGLYDLVLIGSNIYRIDRGVWIIRDVSDVLKIAHISDLHYGAGHPDPVTGNYKRATGLFLINLLKPDLILHTGDDADTASPLQYMYSRAFRYMFIYTIPMLFNTGNHDYQDLGNFIEYYGPYIWYRVYGNKVLFVSINTRGEEARPSFDNILWFESILEKYRDIPIKIVSMHHPVFYWQGELTANYNHTIFYTDPRTNPNSPLSFYWGADLNVTRYFIKLCEDYNVTLVFAGHIHRDQYVKFNSNRMNTTTYFITTTSFAQSRPLYNGFQYIIVNLTLFNMSFPYAPQSFIGFSNYSRTSVRNSIYNEYDYRTMYGWSGKFIANKHAYVFELINGQFNLSNRVVLALPWSGDFKGLKYESINGSNIYVVDYIIVNNILYIALDINLPFRSNLLFIIYNMDDSNPPTILYKMSIPKTPVLGVENKFYFEIVDNEWGVRNIYSWIIFNNTNRTAKAEYVSGDTYLIRVSGITGYEPVVIQIVVKAIDYANLTTIEYFNITLLPTTTPTETPIPTETATTPIETPISTPTETTPTSIETTSPSQTPITSTETEVVTETTPTLTPLSTPTETAEVKEGVNVFIPLIVIAIIALLIVLVTIYYKKRVDFFSLSLTYSNLCWFRRFSQ